MRIHLEPNSNGGVQFNVVAETPAERMVLMLFQQELRFNKPIFSFISEMEGEIGPMGFKFSTGVTPF